MTKKPTKKQVAFRLNENLLDKLKSRAKMANRSLSNHVECILLDSVYNEPNDATRDDSLLSKEEFFKKIDKAKEQYERGDYKTLTPEYRKQLFGGT